jgi:sulfide:quinone oxidoreductase
MSTSPLAFSAHQIVIIGGGAAGLAVAARLMRLNNRLDVAVIEPAEWHYYQPGWTLVGGGVFADTHTRRSMAGLMPMGVTWIREAVASIEPDQNQLILAGDQTIGYEHLIVCSGIVCDWDAIGGLTDTLGQNGVCSNYRYDLAPYTWRCLQDFEGGNAVFTAAPMPFKCPGAPQKILYLAADHFQRNGRPAALHYYCVTPTIFGVPPFARALEKVADRYGVERHYQHNLVAVDGPGHVAIFEQTGPDGQKNRIEQPFDLLHVTPPQRPADFIRTSPLANAAGYVDVDKFSLRHVKYPNVHALGDVASTPNSKTAGAVRQQAPVVVRNLLAQLAGKAATARYDGYGTCPLTTANGRVILAEFVYDGVVTPSFPLDPYVERRSMWWLKTSLLPFLYWEVMLRGYEMNRPHHRVRNHPEPA